MNDERYKYIKRLKLSIQSALFGEITPNMRCVLVDIVNKKIELFFFIDGEVTEDDEENISIIETEVIADFEDDFDIETHIKRIDYPAPIVLDHGYGVYRRKEN
ncbi:TPA: hypothetical protein SMT48_000972 [Proteus mirabilis]|uniref:hypothetical protein n=1 Tax=Proteus mirabilis TaxID=584 RepID=UPI001A2EEB6E|nr:hypothetical protein [Proteus mirabilis]MBI6401682.1 hypothetical protein [Proteus mirabilis]MDM3843344.1 hypothetical protein [Proteus mirabilis]WGY29201.1 hypothetical protein QJS45_04050 [Proteus mirabilis]HEK0805670.1 hypothetical protein [Proteus mirabilis]HEK2627674.1 hypothetical protein [Proteus mirabilis]